MPRKIYVPPTPTFDTVMRQGNFGAQQLRGRPFPHQEVRPAKGFLIQQSQDIFGSVTVSNGVKANDLVSVLANNKQLVFSKVYRTIWINDRAIENWFPRGSNVDLADYPYYIQDGVFYFLDTDVTPQSLGHANDWEDQSAVTITNNSGGDVLFLFDSFVRYIINGIGVAND